MSRDDVIERAARVLQVVDDETGDTGMGLYRRDACALADAGLLVDELPTEPPPVGQARLAPTGTVFVKLSKGRGELGVWASFTLDPSNPTLTDDDVRDWPVLVPETDLDDLRAERDHLAARVAELEEAGAQAVDADVLAVALYVSGHWEGRSAIADIIRAHLPAATRPGLPEGHVAVEPWGLAEWIVDHVGDDDLTGDLNVSAIQGAILTYARRDAEAGEQP